MRIVIFSDSLARPRPDIDPSEKTEYEETYGYLLKKHYECKHEVDILYVESLDTHDAIHWNQRMVAFRSPDLVIYHLGINDCAPRLFKKGSRSIVLSPWFRKVTFDLALKAMSYFRYTLTKFRPMVYTSLNDFGNNIDLMKKEVLSYSQNAKFIFVSIAKSNVLNEKSYGYNRNVERYNEVLKKKADMYIDINELIGNDGLISDGIHLSGRSHRMLYTKLKEIIGRME